MTRSSSATRRDQDLAVEAREGAEGLFHSLRRLVELGDGVEVYPGHVAGSLCGKAMSSKASTTIGFERRFNPALAYDDIELFVAETAVISAPRPPNMERIVELNRGPFVGAKPDPEHVALHRQQTLQWSAVGGFLEAIADGVTESDRWGQDGDDVRAAFGVDVA